MGEKVVYYAVTMDLRWTHGATVCHGHAVQRLHAINEGHAIVIATDRLREWFRGDIDGAHAAEVHPAPSLGAPEPGGAKDSDEPTDCAIHGPIGHDGDCPRC